MCRLGRRAGANAVDGLRDAADGERGETGLMVKGFGHELAGDVFGSVARQPDHGQPSYARWGRYGGYGLHELGWSGMYFSP